MRNFVDARRAFGRLACNWCGVARLGAVAVSLAALVIAATGCGASATRTLLGESSPSVRRYEQIRAELAERESAAATVRKGGCPACAW